MATVALGPSITGIWTSIRMISKAPAAQASTALAPFSTISSSMPSWSIRVRSTIWFTGLSSAASTFMARKSHQSGGQSVTEATKFAASFGARSNHRALGHGRRGYTRSKCRHLPTGA